METHYNSIRASFLEKLRINNQKKTSKLVFNYLGLVSSFLLFSLISSSANAQTTYPVDYQDWTFVEDDQVNHIEGAYKVIKCDATSSINIYLNLFNEKVNADTVNVNITIYNGDLTDSTSTSFNQSFQSAEILVPDCTSSVNSNLRLSVPNGYDPEKLTLKIKFN